MKKTRAMMTSIPMLIVLSTGCDSKQETVNQGREAVKEVISQPFNTLDSAKDSIKQSEDKQKAALEEAEKENK
jgi:ABC-type transporter MlaC component